MIFSQQVKSLTNRHFLNEEHFYVEHFTKLITEVERHTSLAHYNDQSDTASCHVFFKVVEGEPCSLHTQTKDVIIR